MLEIPIQRKVEQIYFHKTMPWPWNSFLKYATGVLWFGSIDPI